MTSGRSTGDDDASGCLQLFGLIIALAILGFIMEYWEFFAWAAGIIVGLILLLLASRILAKHTVGPKLEHAAAVQAAREAGRLDMRAAWLEWQLGSLPAQKRDGARWLPAERLAVVPKATWSVPNLRMHGRSVWSLREIAGDTPLRQQVEARLDRVAAMISDLRDEEFDSRRGQTTDQYVYHQDREIRAAYLEGGSQGVEAIMDTITAARAQAREDAATEAAADVVAQQRNAALRALRETQWRTDARDAHAAWEEQVKKIDE